MKLARLSTASVVGCVAGLVLLAAVALQSYEQMRAKQDEIAGLLELENRIDNFSVASDSLLLFGADADLWRAYRNEARGIRERLNAIAEDRPAAVNAVQHVTLIVESVAAAAGQPAPDLPEAVPDGGERGPLRLPRRSRIIMNQVASHGVALDTAFDQIAGARQRAIAREATWLAGGFAGAAGLFGVLCVAAFVLIHRRISVPARALADTMERVRGGDLAARVEAGGSDELGQLGREFNRLVEYGQTVDKRLREQRAELRRRESMLVDSQRMAAIGSWRLDVDNDRLEWSAETYKLLGLSPATFQPMPKAFSEFVHPDDRSRVLSAEADALQRALPYEAEFRIVLADGEERYVHERAEPEVTEDGRVTGLAGTIQDITEWTRSQERLNQYRQLIEASNDAYVIGDSEYRYVLVNQPYASWFGLESRDIEGRLVPEVLGEEYFRTVIKPELDRAFAGEVRVLETRRAHPVTGTRDLLLRYYPIESPDGEVRQVGAVITDISELKQVEAELDEQSRLVAIAGRTARLGGWAVDVDSRRVMWSDVVAEIHGMPPGYSPSLDEGFGFYSPEWRDKVRATFTDCVEQGRPFDEEFQIVTAQGERLWVRAVAEPVRDEHGKVVRVQGAFQDISARREAENERRRLAEQTRKILESITDAFFTLDEQWRFGYVNAAAEELLERSAAELVGRNVWQAFPEAVGSRIEQEYRRAVSEQVTVSLEEYYPPLGKWFDIRAYPSEDGLSVYFRDSTERHRMMYEDHLTGLASRTGFVQAVTELVDRSGWPAGGIVVMLNVQRLRDVNEAHGYEAGDRLLARIGARLQERAGADAFVSRPGGDDFAVFVPEPGTRDMEQCMKDIGQVFQEPFDLDSARVVADARFGYTSLGSRRRPVESLLREAELAMQRVRAMGAGPSWSAYTSDLNEEVTRRIEITHALRDAISEDQFVLHFQPKVELETGRMIAGEALLRWNHPEWGMMPPASFIQIAEQSQLIGPIGDWVIREACRALREWMDAGLEVVRLAVNVSLVQFTIGDFVKTVGEALDEHGIEPSKLTLEITETIFESESRELFRQLEKLHEMGVQLSLDDFGTGYSSLLYLQQYPFDEIKVDKRFVHQITDDSYSRHIVRTIMGVAEALHAGVVAEGVEDRAMRDALIEVGCTVGQGYYYSVPLDAADFRALLQSRSALPVAL